LTELLEAELPRERGCTALARRLVEQQFEGVLNGQALEDLKLVVSELVDNAYVHGRGQIRLRLGQQADRVRVDVMDEGQEAPIKIRQLGVRGGGHGLRLVDHLCLAWGAVPGQTHVWCELSVTADSWRAPVPPSAINGSTGSRSC
jgi:two-component sensor histidine kinase